MSNPYGFQEVEPEFLDVMHDTVRIYQHTAPDVYGKTGTATLTCTIPAYVDDKTKTYTTANGETIVIEGTAFLGYVVPWLTTADRVEVNDLALGWKSQPVQSINGVSGPDGIHHQEVLFGTRTGGTPQ